MENNLRRDYSIWPCLDSIPVKSLRSETCAYPAMCVDKMVIPNGMSVSATAVLRNVICNYTCERVNTAELTP